MALVTLTVIGTTLLALVATSDADVNAVKGSAFGVSAQNVTVGPGGTPTPYGPTPMVTLPPGGSATPITGHDASESLIAGGVATLFTSGPVDVSTQGTNGPSGSVTSTASISGITGTNGEKFTADKISATCTVNQAGVTGSTTVTNGFVVTNTDSNGVQTLSPQVPTNPAPGFSISGTLFLSAQDTESYTYTFNEQSTSADGTLTVTAVHLHLAGPFTKGDVYIGQVTCGATVTPATTTTTVAPTTTTTVAPTTTTTAPTTTTVAPTTTSTSTSTSLPGGTTTTTTISASGTSLCAQLQTVRAQVNAQINAIETAITQSVPADLRPVIQAQLEAARAQVNAQIDQLLAASGC